MKLSTLRDLPSDDQMTFLRGRVIEVSLSMEAVTRYLYVSLQGENDLDEALHTPQQFSTLVNESQETLAASTNFTSRSRALADSAFLTAKSLYEKRNRVVHDLLHQDLHSHDIWLRSRLSRPQRLQGQPRPEPVVVTADQMIDLVHEIVHATWRLGGALWTARAGSANDTSPYLSARLEPNWDGSVIAGK